MAILDKQKCHYFFFLKNKEQKAKQVLFKDWVPVVGGGYKEKGLEGE
jgi:hypothetical protein